MKKSTNLVTAVTVSLAGGIAWAGSRYCLPEIILWPAVLAVAGVLLLSCRTPFQAVTPKAPRRLLQLFFFLIGALHAGPFLKPPADANHIYNLIKYRQTVTISGRLVQSPSTTGYGPHTRTRLLMAADFLSRPGEELSAVKPVAGLVRLSLQGLPPADLEPGDRFIAKAVLARVYAYATPGVFNYQKFLAGQSIWITGWIGAPGKIFKLKDLAAGNIRRTLRYYRYLPERFRHDIAKFLDHTLDNRTRGLYKAILIGDKSAIPPAILENFKAAGCVHILAISGMHMGLLALLFITALNWLLKRSTWIILHIPVLKTASFLALLPLSGYALIAGFNTPVIRALIMAFFIVSAILFDRDRSLKTNIALAALLILLWNPAALFTASFQLSFGAVIAIAVIYPRIGALFDTNYGQRRSAAGRLAGKIIRWSLAGATLSVAVLLGTAPLLLYNFNRLSLVSPFANLIVEPLICLWSLIIGLAACIVMPFSPALAEGLFHAGSWGLTAAAQITATFAKLPFAALWFTTPSPIEIIAYFLVLGGLIYGKPWQKGSRSKFFIIPALVIIIAMPGLRHMIRLSTDETTVDILDVGQGSSTLLELPQGRTLLLDGGGPRGERFNVGEGIIAPYLWKKRISRIDGVIISHPHADHYNGLAFILRHFKPKTLWINGENKQEPTYQKLLDLAGTLAIEIKAPSAGAMLFQTDRVSLACVAGAGRRTDISINDTNNRSLILKLVQRGKTDGREVSFLFPGDIGKKAEKWLAATKKDINADVLLVPHHGSLSSNNSVFMAAVSPQYVAVSAGRFNNFNFPAPAFVKYCKTKGIKTLITFRDGTTSFTTNGDALKVRCEE